MVKQDKRMGSNPLEGLGLDMIQAKDSEDTEKQEALVHLYASLDAQGLVWTGCRVDIEDISLVEPFIRLFLAAFLPGQDHTVTASDGQSGIVLQFKPPLPVLFEPKAAQTRELAWRWELDKPLHYLAEAVDIDVAFQLHSALAIEESNADEQKDDGTFCWRFGFNRLHTGMPLRILLREPLTKQVQQDAAPAEPAAAEATPLAGDTPAPDQEVLAIGEEKRFSLQRTDWLRIPVRVETGRPYAVRFFDKFNSRRLGKAYDLDALRFRVLRANGRDGYSKSIYHTLQDGWGITNDYDKAEANLIALDDTIILEVKSLRPAYAGNFGVHVAPDEDNTSQRLVLERLCELRLDSQASLWLHFMAQPGERFSISVYDQASGMAGHAYTLPAAVFRIVDVDRRSDYDPACFHRRLGRWGASATADEPAAVIRALDNLVYLNIESRKRTAAGTCAVRVEKLPGEPSA